MLIYEETGTLKTDVRTLDGTPVSRIAVPPRLFAPNRDPKGWEATMLLYEGVVLGLSELGVASLIFVLHTHEL
jgi:hypothetical protein